MIGKRKTTTTVPSTNGAHSTAEAINVLNRTQIKNMKEQE